MTHSKMLTTRRRKKSDKKRLARITKEAKKLGKQEQNMKAGNAGAVAKGPA